MDSTDKAILRLLQADAKISIEKIGAVIGLTHTPIWRRIDRLEKAKIILGSHTRLNRAALGLEITVFASVKLSKHDEKALLQFESAVGAVDEVTDCYSMTGSFDYMLKVVTQSVASYETLLKKRLVHLPHFQDIHTSLALREIKHSPVLPI